MEYIFVAIFAAIVLGLCWLVDRGYTKLFRNQAQHKSGLSVRQNKRYGSIGLVLAVIGIAGLVAGIEQGSSTLAVGSGVIILFGVGLIVYFMSSGIYYDDDGFIVESFGRKRALYRYDQILHQQLYMLQGGGIIVELHMQNGQAVQVVSTMPDYDKFLHHAFANWCRQKGINPEKCDFHDPVNSLWFPSKEEI